MKAKTLVILGIVALALALAAALALGGSALAQTPPTTNPQAGNHCGLTLEEMRAYHDSVYGAGSFDQLHRDGQLGPSMMGGWSTPNGTGGTTGTWRGYGGMMGSWR